MFSSVVLDGTNIITERKHVFRLERLQNTIKAVKSFGWRTKTILKEEPMIGASKVIPR